MKVQIQKQIGFIIICVAFLASFGNFAFSAGWEYEGYTYWNNVLTTDDIGVYEFDIGNTDYTWYWTNAYTIGFDEDPDNEMRFYDINGGYSKLFIAKFEFTRPITTFQFVTPQMVNHIIDTNSSVRWDYSLDGTNWTTLWRYEGVNNNVLNFGPIETPIQKFMTDANVTQIWIGYCMEKGDSTAYAQSVNFYDEVDDGGLLRVTVGDEFSAGDAYDTSFDDYTLTEITGKGTPAWAAGYAWPGAETGGTVVNTESYRGYKSLYLSGLQTSLLDLGTQYVDKARWFEFAFKPNFVGDDNSDMVWAKTIRGARGDIEGICLELIYGGQKIKCNGIEIGTFTNNQWHTISFRHVIVNGIFIGVYDVYLDGTFNTSVFAGSGYSGLRSLVFSSAEATWLHQGSWYIDEIHIGAYPVFVDSKGYAGVIGSDYTYHDYKPRELWNESLMRMGYKPVMFHRDDLDLWQNSLDKISLLFFSKTYDYGDNIAWGDKLGMPLNSWIYDGGILVLEGANSDDSPVSWISDINDSWDIVTDNPLCGFPTWFQSGLLSPHTLPDGVEAVGYYMGRIPYAIPYTAGNGGLTTVPTVGTVLTKNKDGRPTTWADNMGSGTIVVSNYFQGYALNNFLLEDILNYMNASYVPVCKEGLTIAQIVSEVEPIDPNKHSPIEVSYNDDGILLIDGVKQFPSGFWGVTHPNSMQMMVDEGFDFAWGPSDDIYDENDYDSLMATSAHLATYNIAGMVEVIDDYILEDNLIIWQLAEEPENNGAMSNYQVKLANAVAKKLDPDRITGLMVNNLACVEAYADIADVFQVDPYYIGTPTCPLLTPRDYKFVKGFTDKPIWSLLQAHWNIGCLLTKPTTTQLTALMYAALANNVKAIAWFILDTPDAPDYQDSYLRNNGVWLEEQREQWERILGLIDEYAVIKPWIIESDSNVTVSSSHPDVSTLCFTKPNSPEHLLVVVNALSTAVSNAVISWPLDTTNYDDAFISLHNADPNIPLSPAISVNTSTDTITVSLSGYQRGVYKFSLLPNQASTPTPVNTSAGVSITPLLTWTTGKGATSHDVYFGTNQTSVDNATHASAEYKGNKTDPNYLPAGNLSLNTTYYWRIDEVDSYGTTKGTVWSFTTSNSAPTWVATGAVTHSTAAITPALPSGIATNDILLLFVETYNQSVSISNQNGGTWAQVAGSYQGTTGTRLTVFWSRYNGTQGAPTTSDSGDHQIGRIIAIRRGITAYGTPWDITAGGVEATSDKSGSIPGATTTVANTLVVTAIATSLPDYNYDNNRFSSWVNANLTSLTERVDCSRNSGNGGGLGIATGVRATAGAYGNTAVTLASSATKGMMSIAIKP